MTGSLSAYLFALQHACDYVIPTINLNSRVFRLGTKVCDVTSKRRESVVLLLSLTFIYLCSKEYKQTVSNWLSLASLPRGIQKKHKVKILSAASLQNWHRSKGTLCLMPIFQLSVKPFCQKHCKMGEPNHCNILGDKKNSWQQFWSLLTVIPKHRAQMPGTVPRSKLFHLRV